MGSEMCIRDRLRELGLETPSALTEQTGSWSGLGAGVLHVIRDGEVIGAVAVEDKVRAESKAAVRALQDRGVRVAMVTGDARQVAEAVGAELGLSLIHISEPTRPY